MVLQRVDLATDVARSGVFSLADGTVVTPADPVFITGSGRCGTTLMRRLVIERTGLVVPPENYTLGSSSGIMEEAAGDWGLFCRLVLSNLAENAAGWAAFGLDRDRVLPLLESVPAGWRDVAHFWHAFHAIYAVSVGRPGSQWGDKTPFNTLRLKQIVEIFPAARFIFLLRDVFDMAFSYGSMQMLDRPGDYLFGAKRWLLANIQILEFCREFPGQVMMVRYEDLALEPEREMRRVLRHLRVAADAGHALTAREAADIAMAPHLRNVLGTVSGDFIGKGRAALPNAAKHEIALMTARLQVRLGYEPTGLAAFPLRPVGDRPVGDRPVTDGRAADGAA